MDKHETTAGPRHSGIGQARSERVVGVWPPDAGRGRSRFFEALDRLTGVRFEPMDEGSFAARALLVLGSDNDLHLPEGSSSVPTLVLNGGAGPSQVGAVTFVDSPHVDPSLRAQTLLGNWLSGQVAGGDGRQFEVLATAGGDPVWRRHREEPWLEIVAVDLPELGTDEQLRHRLRPGHCLGMIALVHFVRSVFGEEWSPPPTRACIVIDDPNMRKSTYGHIDYTALVEHADRFDYHIAFAHIPLDFDDFDSMTVELFRSHPARLSLAPHGNNHTRRELLSVRSVEEADRALAQAMRRAGRFERRTGLTVAKVMVPPHGRCSELVLREMARLGYESATMGRPRIDLDVVAGFAPAVVSDSGLPILPRYKLFQLDQAILCAFLGQPVVLYGHEPDFSDGLGFLERASNVINRIEGLSWGDLQTVSRSNFLIQRRGDRLNVRAFARRVSLQADPDVGAIVVEPLVDASGDRECEVVAGVGDHVIVLPDSARSTIVLPGSDAPTSIEVQLESATALDPLRIPDPPFRVSPYARRLITEVRDRTHPFRRRVSQRRQGSDGSGRRPTA